MRRGIVVVEAALIFPLLLLILLGLLEYGWIFFKSEEINNAARHGCRIGVTEPATQSQVLAAIDALMVSANMPQGTSGYTATLSADPASLNSGDPFSVTVTVPYANIELIGIPLVPVPTDLDSQCTMVKEGPP